MSNRQEAEERAADLRRRFTQAELRRFFVERSHDTLFSFVGEPVTLPFADAHVAVWNGFDLAVRNAYAGCGELPTDEDEE
jgi:hypothetical protein